MTAGLGLLLCGMFGSLGSMPDGARELVATESERTVRVPAAAPSVSTALDNSQIEAHAPMPGITAAPRRDPDVQSVSLKERFLQDRDLAPLFDEVVARAGRGDAEAAYYAYRIHELCHQRLRPRSMSRDAVVDLLDRVAQRAGEQGSEHDPTFNRWLAARLRHLRRVWQACSDELLDRLDRHGAGEWLETAAELGYPLAQAMAAHRLLVASLDEEDVAAARRYLQEAVKSREPETLFEIGRSASLGFLGPGDPVQRGNAWMLVACWHGFDCGPDGELVAKYMCPQLDDPRCVPGADLAKYLERRDPEAYPATFALADQIMQAMNDGRWEDLGL
jgi:hypothetical protein